MIVSGGDPTGGLLPIFILPPRDIVIGVGLHRRCWASLAGAMPAVGAMRLRIVDALRRRADMLNALKQIVAVTALNLRTIPQRLGSSVVAVVGIAGVVVVFVAVLSIAEGFRPRCKAPDRRSARSSCAAAPTAR